MNPELENLINMALADGEVTEKERGIILRKAEALGFDVDEAEMIIDGKIALQKKELEHSQLSKDNISNKAGDIIKCPSCGSPTHSFATKCNDCGHEFRNIKAEGSIIVLFDLLQTIEEKERNKTKTNISMPFGLKIDNWWSWEDELALSNRLANTIAAYPVPNSKEAILEFIALALPQTKIKIKKGFFGLMDLALEQPKVVMKQAWKNKIEQVIVKARFSMKEDRKMLYEIENYAKQLNIK